MKKVKITAIFPTYCHGLDSRVKSEWLTAGLIRQLPRLSYKLQLPKEKPTPVTIRGLSARQAKTIFGGRFSKLCFKIHFVEFQTTTTFDPDNWEPGINCSLDQRFRYFCDTIRSSFESLLERLLIASNIARPGSMSIWEGGIIFCEKHDYHVDFPFWKFSNNLARLTDSSDIKAWPKVKFLRLDKAWKWLNCLPDFEKGFGSSPLGRALAAFTELFSYGKDIEFPDPPPITYLMSIVGLESIYDSNGSQRMLKERCELFLNDSEVDKKIVDDLIKELYERRSAIIHGGMNMPFKFGGDESSETEKAWEKVWSLDAATPILVATFQKMVLLNIHQLQFELRLKKKTK